MVAEGQHLRGVAPGRDFQAERADVRAAKPGDTVDGKLVYAQNCAACHGTNGEGGKGRKLVGSAALQNEQALRGVILNGGTAMPGFPQLQGAQLDALVKFMQGW